MQLNHHTHFFSCASSCWYCFPTSDFVKSPIHFILSSFLSKSAWHTKVPPPHPTCTWPLWRFLSLHTIVSRIIWFLLLVSTVLLADAWLESLSWFLLLPKFSASELPLIPKPPTPCGPMPLTWSCPTLHKTQTLAPFCSCFQGEGLASWRCRSHHRPIPWLYKSLTASSSWKWKMDHEHV